MSGDSSGNAGVAQTPSAHEGKRLFLERFTTPSYRDSVKATLTFSWTNILLAIFLPIGWVLHFHLEGAYLVVAIINLIALAAVSYLLRFSFDQLALCFGSISGIIREIELNLIEFIFAIFALKSCDLQTIQAVLLGVIISNLPVLGISLMVAGYYSHKLSFDRDKAQINCTLLMLGAAVQLLPGVVSFATVWGSSVGLAPAPSSESPDPEPSLIPEMIRLISIFVIILYFLYGCFRYHCHKQKQKQEKEAGEPTQDPEKSPEIRSLHPDSPKPKLNGVVAILLLGGSVVLTTLTTNYLWEALGNLDINPQFEGAILVPLVSGFGEVMTLVKLIRECVRQDSQGYQEDNPTDTLDEQADPPKDIVEESKDKVVDTSGGGTGEAAAGNSHLATEDESRNKPDRRLGNVRVDRLVEELNEPAIQISLFITPLLVVIGWAMNIPLLIINDPMSSAILFMSVLILNYVLNDGESNWFEGAVLLISYTIFAIALWHYPGINLAVMLEKLQVAQSLNVCDMSGNPLNSTA